MKTPQHILDKANEDPRVTVLEYTYDRELPPLDAETVARYLKTIRAEFVQLLHQTSSSDTDLRHRLKTHKQFADFAERYPMLFSKITNRDIVTSDALMSAVYFQVYVLEQVQKGAMTESQAQAAIAKASFDAFTREMRRQGVTPQSMPSLEAGKDHN